MSNTLVGDQVTKRPWDLVCLPLVLIGNHTNQRMCADLVIVLFLNGVERINLEPVLGVVAIIGQELILHCQSRALLERGYQERHRSSLEYAWVLINA
jgi:hypothetical protein